MEKKVYGCTSGWHLKDCGRPIFWNTIPVSWADLLDPQNLLFTLSNNCFQKPKPNPDQNPQTPGRPVNGWSLDFCASMWQSDIFIAKRRLEKMQNKIAKLQKEEKGEGGGGRRKKKQKAPFPLLIEFKGITCSTLQQMGSYTNFKAIKRYKVPCGAGLHWS